MKCTSYLPAYEDGTGCSETLAYKIQTPGNYPEESIQTYTGLSANAVSSNSNAYAIRHNHPDTSRTVTLLTTTTQIFNRIGRRVR